MNLTIITINYNNASGLERTIESILNQTSINFEYLVVDGGSTDDSCRVICDKLDFFNKQTANRGHILNGDVEVNGIKVKWISEKDDGIYNAMNKGIRMANGEFVQFVNSGDFLAANNVTEQMLSKLEEIGSESEVQLLYGNMLKPYKGKIIRDKGFEGKQPTLLDFYNATLNHSPAYIKRNLFDRFGYYDESLKIVSDWKWYLQVIALNNVFPYYANVDVTVFDMNGISTQNSSLEQMERNKVLQEIIPMNVLTDYSKWANVIEQFKRIERYPIVKKIFFIVERIIFKWEKRYRNPYVK